MKKEVDLLPELRAHIARKYRTQSGAAKAWGVSCGFVCMVLKGERAPTKDILNDVGLEAIVPNVRYVRKAKT